MGSAGSRRDPADLFVAATDGHIAYRFDASLPPILDIESGTSVTIETRSGEDRQLRPGDGPDAVERIDFGRLHALTGPIAIRGATPGELLAVTVEALEPGPTGFILQRPGAGLLRGFPNYLRFVELDGELGVGRFAGGIDIPLAPFLGVMGVAPAGPAVRTIEPGSHGGNLDCRDLVAGTTLYLPVQVPGALFSCGDAHAAQGDGEVCVTAIETEVRARLRFDRLDPVVPVVDPIAETPDAWLTLAAAESLEAAAARAVAAMIDLIVASSDLDRSDAYALVSVAADVRVNQVVNGNRPGARVVLPKRILALAPIGRTPADLGGG